MSAVSISPSVLVASPKKGYKTAADLIAAAKAKPGELNFASAGIGAASHLSAEKFQLAAGIKAQHIPFRGPVDALAEVMAGRIDFYFLPLAAAIGHIRSGNVTPLAVSSDTRAPQLPDVPTTAEIGYPAAAYAFWNGVFVPVKTPPDIVDQALSGDAEGDRRSGREGQAGEGGRAAAGDVAARLPEVFRG